MILRSSGEKPKTLSDALQCTGQPPTMRTVWPKKAIVLRPKNPGLELFTNKSVPLAH